MPSKPFATSFVVTSIFPCFFQLFFILFPRSDSQRHCFFRDPKLHPRRILTPNHSRRSKTWRFGSWKAERCCLFFCFLERSKVLEFLQPLNDPEMNSEHTYHIKYIVRYSLYYMPVHCKLKKIAYIIQYILQYFFLQDVIYLICVMWISEDAQFGHRMKLQSSWPRIWPCNCIAMLLGSSRQNSWIEWNPFAIVESDKVNIVV